MAEGPAVPSHQRRTQGVGAVELDQRLRRNGRSRGYRLAARCQVQDATVPTLDTGTIPPQGFVGNRVIFSTGGTWTGRRIRVPDNAACTQGGENSSDRNLTNSVVEGTT